MKCIVKSFVLSLIFLPLLAIADANQSAINSGVTWLVSQQNQDGSWGQDDATQYIVTAEAVNALRKTGNWNNAYYKGVTWLENHASDNTDYSSRKIKALVLRGNDLSVPVSFLETNQDLNTAGWGISSNYSGANLDTALALIAHSISPTSADITNAVNFLVNQQISMANGGGWSLGSNTTADTITSALALRALSLLQSSYPTVITSTVISEAATAVVNLESGASSLVRAYISLALSESGEQTTALTNMINTLVSASGSGDWGTADAHTVAMALQALGTYEGFTDTAKLAVVSFPDQVLRETVNTALNRNAMDSIRALEAEQLAGELTLNNVTNLTGLSALTNLTSLTLNGNAFTNFGEISSLTNLEYLDLSQTNITLAELSSMLPLFQSLKVLDLRSINFSSASDIAFLQHLPNLKRVYLSSSAYSPNCFSFFGTPTIIDSDSDGSDDCTEYRASTNMWHEDSHPYFSKPFHLVAGQNQYISIDMSAAFARLNGTGLLRTGSHAVWSDLDGDGDLDAAIYIHGADEENESEELSCWFDCSVGYYGRWTGEFLLYENVNGIYTERTVIGSTQPRNDIRDFYVFDYDSDGNKDVLLVTKYDMFLYRNTGSMQFENVTSTVIPASISDGVSFNFLSKTQLLDANMDGYVDLFINKGSQGVELYRYDSTLNEYIDITAASGLLGGYTTFGGADIYDVDLDGILDMLVYRSDDTINPVHLYTGNGDGTFTNTPLPAANFTLNTSSINRGIRRMLRDYDNDGKMDVVSFSKRIVNSGPSTIDYAGAQISLLKNLTDTSVTPLSPSFEFQSQLENMLADPGGTMDFPRGGAIIDFDNDGDVDFLKAEGWGRDYLFEQIDSNNFSLITDRSLVNLEGENKHPITADMDNDGALDLLIPRGRTTRSILYPLRNQNNNNNGLNIHLVGNSTTAASTGYKSTPQAIGARVVVTAGTDTYTQQVLPTFGNDTLLHFGVGNETAVDITVYWPSGRAPTTLLGQAVNGTIEIVEP